MGYSERKTIMRDIESKRGTRVLCYLTSDRPNATAQIAKDVMPIIYRHLRQMDPIEKLDVFLLTAGGDAQAAFGIAQMIREFAPWVGALIPEKCQSGGTLFVLGANEIVMTRAATLGPIDPSLAGPLSPSVETEDGKRTQVAISVESVAGLKELVVADWEMTSEAARIEAFRILAERVHPMALGDVVRSRDQIARLALQLLSNHRDDADAMAGLIKTLTRSLGSHDYLIFRSEARTLFGPQIAANDAELEDLIWKLYEDYQEDMELGVPFIPTMLAAGKSIGQSVKITTKAAVIETTVMGDAAVTEWQVSKVEVPGPKGSGRTIEIRPEVVGSGWTHYDS